MLTAISSFCYSQTNSDVIYNRKNPQTLVVLIPLLSLFVQNIQVNGLKIGFINSPRMPNQKLKQLDINYTWNALGSLVQHIVFVTLIIFTNSLLFLPFACLSLYQFNKSFNGIKETNKTFYSNELINERLIDKIWKVLSKDNPYAIL